MITTFEEIRDYLINPKRKRVSGEVYVVFSSLTGLTKIGRSKNFKKRIKALQTATPGELQLVHWFPADDMDGAETYYHFLFHDKWVSGEWFRLSFESDDYWSIRERGPWNTDEEIEGIEELIEWGKIKSQKKNLIEEWINENM